MKETRKTSQLEMYKTENYAKEIEQRPYEQAGGVLWGEEKGTGRNR